MKFKIALGDFLGDVALSDVLTFDIVADATQFSFNINSIGYIADGEFDLLEGAYIDTIIYGIHYFDEYTVAPGAKVGPLKVVAHMAESAGNEYMNKKLEGLGLNIIATQATGDQDSYDGTYDAFASYAGVAYEIPAMDETVDATLGEDFVIEHDNGSVIIEGTANHTTVNATVTESEPKVQIVSEGNKIASYDIKVDGYAGDVTVSLFLGYNFGDIAVYHEGALMDSADYSYDPVSGYITFVTDSFSVFDIEYCADKFVPVATYAELLDQMNAGNNVVLAQDLHCDATSGNAIRYEKSESFVIDLNGYKMTTDTDNGILLIRNDGAVANEISIINGTLETDDTTYCTILTAGFGSPLTLNLDNVNIYSQKDFSQSVKAFSGSTINITNCHFNNKQGGGIEVVGGTVNLLGENNVFEQSLIGNPNFNANNISVSNGGEINVYGGKYTASFASIVIMSSGGTVNVFGGEFATSTDSHVAYVCLDGGAVSDAKLTVSGGSFDNLTTATVNDGVIYAIDYLPTDSYASYVTVYADDVAFGSVTNEYNSANVKIIKETASATDVSNAIANGETAQLSQDITWNTKITKDASIDLNGNTFEATSSFEAKNDVSMSNGSYVSNGTFGNIDSRNSETSKANVLTFENVDFTTNYKSRTYGPCTDRLNTVLEVCAIVNDAETEVFFKNCTFNNAQVLLEALSGITAKAVVVFENCTFNALTSSGPINVKDTGVVMDITVKNCTFNLEVTSSTASAISINAYVKDSSVTLEGTNVINAVKATATTDPALIGTVDEIKVIGNPTSVNFISCGDGVTVTNNGTIETYGIAVNNVD